MPPETRIMANILLVDNDGVVISELTERLGTSQHRVTALHAVGEAIGELRTRRRSYELIALNLSRNRPEDWNALYRLQETLRFMDAVTRIVCFSTAYHGPEMQLAVERIGARFVHLG